MTDTYASSASTGTPAPSLPVDQAMAAVGRGFRIGTRTVLKLFLMLSVLIMVLQGLNGIPNLVTGLGADLRMPEVLLAGQILSYVMTGLVIVLSFLVGGLSLGLYRVIRVALVSGPEAVRDQGAFAIARERYGWALLSALIFAIILIVGLLMCVLPGIAALLFLGMMPFLVVAVDDDLGTGFQRSVSLFLANAGPILLGYLAVFLIQVVVIVLSMVIGAVFGFGGAAIGIATEMPATVLAGATSLSAFIGGLLGIPFGFASLIIMSSIFTAVDANDRGQPLMLDDDLLV